MLRVALPPEGAGAGGGQQYEDQERLGHAVRQQGQARFAERCVLHQGHDLRVTRLPTHAFDPDMHRRGQVVAAGDNTRAGSARHRFRFPREQRLVHACFAQHHHAVGGERLAWQNAQGVADREPARRDGLESAVGPLPLHAVGQPVQGRLQRTGGALAQPQFEPAPGEQEEHEHGERVEEHLAAENSLRIESARAADREGDRHAQRHRQVHTHAAMRQVAQRAVEKRPA